MYQRLSRENMYSKVINSIKGYDSDWDWALNPVKKTLPFFQLWDSSNSFSNIKS